MTQKLAREFLNLLACPYCRAGLSQPGPEALHCSGCGQSFPVINGIPDLLPKENLGAEFLKSIDSWNQEWQRLGLPPRESILGSSSYAAALEHIEKQAPARNSWGVFLESGCGNGQIAWLVARTRKASLVVGIDACMEACRQAKTLFEREGDKGFFVCGDLKRLPFKDQAFGYVFGWGSLEHFPDTQPAVDEAYRVLAVSGRVSHLVPAVSLATLSYFQLWGNIPELPWIRPFAEWFHMRLLGGRHMRFGYEKSFTVPGLKRYFSKAGFANIQVDCLDRYVFERPKWLLPVIRRIARWRLFWPMMHLEADRKEQR